MSNNIKYSIEQIEGNFVARSTVKSFNLDHVTDKDITSYYKNISSQALFDTGLMPLNGTGVLSIRSAGNHTQIAYQHAPQMSYINWGANEGDARAISYYVAQPYRIWIADLVDGNLFGARMFYSPYPITTSSSPLYHINLPNTNCQGYRGNGVGWICLYHTEDWSNLSFNVKLQKLIERCSGVETYNDANMSETDGPRFYAKYSKPAYVINPRLWEEKSVNEGIDWTLDPDLWIPVLVTDLDNQSQHDPNGQPLTFAMALLGDYNAYYNDPYHPKLINAFARQDIEIPAKNIFNIFQTSYNASSSEQQSFNQFEAASIQKQKIAEQQLVQKSLFTTDDNEDFLVCPICEEAYNPENEEMITHDHETYCSVCFSEHFVYCENTEEYLHEEDGDLYYVESEEIYIDLSCAFLKECTRCSEVYWTSSKANEFSMPVYNIQLVTGQSFDFCRECYDNLFDELKNDYNINFLEDDYSHYRHNCDVCSVTVFTNLPDSIINSAISLPDFHFADYSGEIIDLINDKSALNEFLSNKESFILSSKNYCAQHAPLMQWCPSGSYLYNPNIVDIDPWFSPSFKIQSTGDIVYMKVNSLSKHSLNSDWPDSITPFSLSFSPLAFVRSLAAVAYGIAPRSSQYFRLYFEDSGEEYTYSE